MSSCSPQCYTSSAPDGDCKCVCGGANHGQGAGGVPAVTAAGEVIDGKPPADTPGPVNVDARQLSTPQAQGELLDQLTLQNIAHNLHYATRGGYEQAQAGNTPPTFEDHAARGYVRRYLNLSLGISNPDEGMIDAAVARWHALYPQDRLDGAQAITRPQAEGTLPSAPDMHEPIKPGARVLISGGMDDIPDGTYGTVQLTPAQNDSVHCQVRCQDADGRWVTVDLHPSVLTGTGRRLL